ncbi:putative triacylglycerol lipase [Lupinus albus]|uniref:Putative triacylglycerol lipase n=1 Tax=Lupinus albus TaxID=3870 RepID=A0A6A4QVI7_LUPAL|nr:putative triacylglycerol lipase [Lupinus albus]
MKEIYELGARHVWVFSTLPLGCLPGGRASAGQVTCNEVENGLATQFNGLLQKGVDSIKTTTPDYDVQFVDVYTPLRNIVANPSASGFTNEQNGCCGGTAVASGELCAPFTGQCSDPSTYVFWDFAHPTQRTYEIIVSNILQQHK